MRTMRSVVAETVGEPSDVLHLRTHPIPKPGPGQVRIPLMGDGSMHYAITALWTAAHYRIPLTVVVASNAEYGVLKMFGAWEKTAGVPGLDLPGLNVVGTAASYGVDAHEAHSTDEVVKLVESGIADRERPTLINARTTHVDA